MPNLNEGYRCGNWVLPFSLYSRKVDVTGKNHTLDHLTEQCDWKNIYGIGYDLINSTYSFYGLKYKIVDKSRLDEIVMSIIS